MCCLSFWDLPLTVQLCNYLHTVHCMCFVFVCCIDFKELCPPTLQRYPSHSCCITIVHHRDHYFFLFWKSNCALISPSFQPWQEIISQPVILWVLCYRNIQSGIVSLSCGIGAGRAASVLVSSARQQELREIQEATWHMITSFSWLAIKLWQHLGWIWQSNYNSVCVEYVAWRCRIVALTVHLCGL